MASFPSKPQVPLPPPAAMADTLEFNEIYQEVKGSMVSEGRRGSRGGPGGWHNVLRPALPAKMLQGAPPPAPRHLFCHLVLAEGVLLISPGSGGASFPGLKLFGASTGAFSASPLQSKRGCGWECFQEEGEGMPALRVHRSCCKRVVWRLSAYSNAREWVGGLAVVLNVSGSPITPEGVSKSPTAAAV